MIDGYGRRIEAIYLQRDEDCMCLASYPHHDGALFHGFRGILDLENTALRRAVDTVSIIPLTF